MWQVAIAAAVAGSGFLANRFFTTTTLTPHPDHGPAFTFSTGSGPETDPETKEEGNGSGSGYRVGLKSRAGKKEKNKNKKGEFSENKGNVEGFKVKCGGNRVTVCAKKRRTSKNGPGKCDACSCFCSSSKGNSVFNWRIGVGIMYMMSAGKAEINKLNAAMDETAKVVYELKSELSKRKISHNHQISSSGTEISTKLDNVSGKGVPLQPQSSAEVGYNVQDYSSFSCERNECASIVFSGEPQGEGMEMDLLEAELESELQKLSWSSTDASGPEASIIDSYEIDDSTEGAYEHDGLPWNSHLTNGVAPSVLNQKLCNLLIKQQEGQIVELESELNQAQSQLQEREAELQALKDCVRRMSEVSLANASDAEAEAQLEEEKNSRAVVGMKRTMAFEPYSCHVTSN